MNLVCQTICSVIVDIINIPKTFLFAIWNNLITFTSCILSSPLLHLGVPWGVEHYRDYTPQWSVSSTCGLDHHPKHMHSWDWWTGEQTNAPGHAHGTVT